MRIAGLLFNGLTKVGPGLRAVPDGARSWRREGLSTYTFELKKLRFSNGRAVTAEDLEFSFQEFVKKGSFFYGAFQKVKSLNVFQKDGKLFVRIRLKKPSATFLAADLPVIKILPKQESAQKEFSKRPFGSGPFKLVRSHSHEILLKRREPFGQAQYISFAVVRDSFTRVQKTLAGEIDIAPSVIPLEKISYFKPPDFQIHTKPGLSATYLLLNLKNPHLKQRRIRRALSLLINREEILRFHLKGYGTAARSLIHPENRFFNKNLPEAVFSVTQSRALTRGTKNSGGVPLRLSCSNNKSSLDKARVLSGQISKGDFDIKLESYEWGVFYRDIQNGRFDIALMKWVGVMDPDIYRVAFHSENFAPSGRNRSFYSHPELDRLLDKAVPILDERRRKTVYDKIQEIVARDVVIIPLWHEKEIAVVKKGVKGYRLPDNGDFSSLPFARK